MVDGRSVDDCNARALVICYFHLLLPVREMPLMFSNVVVTLPELVFSVTPCAVVRVDVTKSFYEK